MKKIFLILLFAVSYELSAVSCQLDTIAKSQKPKAKSQYLKSYWHSGLTVLSQPLHYDWKDWTVFGGVAAATTLAFVYDDEIYSLVDKSLNNKQSENISKYTDVFGEEYFILPSVALTYAFGSISDNCRLKNLSLAALQSFIYAEVASAGLKVLTCRLRPSEFNSQQPTAKPGSVLLSLSKVHHFLRVMRCVLLLWQRQWQDFILRKNGLGLFHIHWRR